MKRGFVGSLLVALLLLGCGGTDGSGLNGGPASGTGEVSGVVFDQNGNPARGVRVYFDGAEGNTAHETVTNSTGAYILSEMPAESDGYDIVIRAEATVDGASLTGQNIARVFDGERTKNLNVGLYPAGKIASLNGTVTDRDGYLIRGARVFARPQDATVPSSSFGITNGDGYYEIKGLLAGIRYDVHANASTYSTDEANGITLSANQNRKINFEMGSATDPNLPAPKNVIATAWTSPSETSRDQMLAQAVEGVKNLIKPKRSAAKITRSTTTGYPIEVDIEWDQVDANSLLGYGVYRGTTSSNLKALDFVRDPLAIFFADSDSALNQATTYTYAVSALNTSYPDSNHGESDLSAVVQAKTLGALTLGTFDSTTTTFHWTKAVGAEEYTVYIFDDYPTASPSVRYQSSWMTTPYYHYGGPTLSSGNTYYYLVVGHANDGASLTVSRVASFVAP